MKYYLSIGSNIEPVKNIIFSIKELKEILADIDISNTTVYACGSEVMIRDSKQKLIDHGFATKTNNDLLKTRCGTKSYMAPEFFLGK